MGFYYSVLKMFSFLAKKTFYFLDLRNVISMRYLKFPQRLYILRDCRKSPNCDFIYNIFLFSLRSPARTILSQGTKNTPRNIKYSYLILGSYVL
jgi:hypothetical protein